MKYSGRWAKALVGCMLPLLAGAEAAGPVKLDFEKAEVGAAPADAMVLAGEFKVRQEARNRYLELGALPLDSTGLMLGPADATLARASVRGEATGKRMPEMAVGLGGLGGYQAWLMPAVGEVQIRRDDAILARAPYAWEAGKWTVLELRILPEGAKWSVEARAWGKGSEEKPAVASLVADQAPPKGQATIWGATYSEKPIGFDDVVVGHGE